MDGMHGQLGDGTNEDRHKPKKIIGEGVVNAMGFQPCSKGRRKLMDGGEIDATIR